MSDGLKGCITAAASAAHRFCSDRSEDNERLLNHHLKDLIQFTATVDPSARLSIKNLHLCELLHYCSLLLNENPSWAISRSRLHLFLFNIAFHNVSLRKYLAADLQICESVFECLKLSLQEQLGPQNLVDVLRLLQVLTYERSAVLGVWTNSLISFLLSEIICDDEPQWLPYCMAILCNLAARSKSVCLRIGRSVSLFVHSSYKAFSRKLLQLLAHDSRTVVIACLVLVGFLEEKLRDTIFCARNIPQTFQCVFNVLILGDHLMTRCIAVDLLKRLVFCESSSVSSSLTLTSTGKDLASYSYFEKTIQLVATLLIQIDPRTEESFKVYDLFLALCSVPQLRSAVAHAILHCHSNEEKPATPLLAICDTAGLSFDEAIEPEVPLKAIRLLICLLQELVESTGRVEDVVPIAHILQLVENNVKTAIETVSDSVKFQCQRITEGLRLAEIVSTDEDIRVCLLEVVNAALCSHIIESQIISNPVITYIRQPESLRTEPLPEWCNDGVAIVLELMRILISLKDYSKSHKDLYLKVLKDDRLIPFIAYAIAHGNAELTHKALLLFVHCSQFHTFPTKWLGDLVATCRKKKSIVCASRDNYLPKGSSEYCLNISVDDTSTVHKKPLNDLSTKDDRVIQFSEISDNIHQKNELPGFDTLRLLSINEKKIQNMKNRERELEDLLAKKEEALRESELLRNRNNQENENEIASLRDAIVVSKKKIEDLDKLLISLRTEKQNVEEICESYKKTVEKKEEEVLSLTDEYDSLKKVAQEKNVLQEENNSERELATLMKSRYDELRKNFALTSNALIEKDKQCAQLMNEHKNMEHDLMIKKSENIEVCENLKRLEKEMMDIRNSKNSEIKHLQDLVDEKVKEIECLNKELQKVLKFKSNMLRMMDEI
ncbi:unnamed protein product [Thelazia callipaeda]|uniref:Protein CIP2A n=1 Tax=Thelazia callipaeda TaxID=103827 RepID=A0A0N5CY00_THECL|nr:unnamed protein product [Thelazia callipaeda]